MPGQHNENTKLLGFYADLELVSKMDEARAGKDRSQFLREAVVEYVVRHGVDVPEHLRFAPDRTGKGGRHPIHGTDEKNIAASSIELEKLKSAARPKPKRAK